MDSEHNSHARQCHSVSRSALMEIRADAMEAHAWQGATNEFDQCIEVHRNVAGSPCCFSLNDVEGHLKRIGYRSRRLSPAIFDVQGSEELLKGALDPRSHRRGSQRWKITRIPYGEKFEIESSSLRSLAIPCDNLRQQI